MRTRQPQARQPRPGKPCLKQPATLAKTAAHFLIVCGKIWWTLAMALAAPEKALLPLARAARRSAAACATPPPGCGVVVHPQKAQPHASRCNSGTIQAHAHLS